MQIILNLETIGSTVLLYIYMCMCVSQDIEKRPWPGCKIKTNVEITAATSVCRARCLLTLDSSSRGMYAICVVGSNKAYCKKKKNVCVRFNCGEMRGDAGRHDKGADRTNGGTFFIEHAIRERTNGGREGGTDGRTEGWDGAP